MFLALEIALPAVLSAALALWLRAWYVAPLVFLPLWEATRPLVERLSLRGVAPACLPRLKEESREAAKAQVLITVSTLLPDAKDAGQLQDRLRALWQSNARKNIKICCLADFKGAKTPECPQDRAAIAAAKRAVDTLNRQYGGGFILAVRARLYSPTQGNFTGWERKRGAITQLVSAIRGDTSGFSVLHGDVATLGKTTHLLALDADTLLPMDTAAQLIAVAMHPLNRPQINHERGLVTQGYGIIVPRMENELFGKAATSFMGLMAGDGGITVYDSFACERYQDLFDEGIFAGKGLLDVQAFHTLLHDVFPPEQVLSHDILEGGFLRAGFVSDLQAADGFPKKQSSYLARLNRWVRGDWQNIGFLFGKNALSPLSRYKLFDNLRRSLTPVLLLLCMLVSAFLSGRLSTALLVCALLGAAGPGLLAALRCLAKGGPHMVSRLYYSGAMPAALSALVRGFLAVIMLPQTAFVSLDAIVRALWRTFVSRKKLLEWTTAAQSEQEGMGAKSIAAFWPSLLSGALLFVLGGPLSRLCAILFWLDIPFALLTGRPGHDKPKTLSYFAQDKLQSYAAAMWRYFEEQCIKENNFLPPDNFQETPVYTVAHRTSPTNIGLALLCTLAARDFGFISTQELAQRLEQTLTSVEQLETWHGNLLNWYDTRSLAPLKPKYVSTVDTGNFLCSLVTLRQGLREYTAEEPALRELCRRIDSLIAQSDLTVLYNEKRKLFHIGMDVSSGTLSGSFYDLLMSEARMTGYFAVAKRIVPKKHWGALGRMLVKDGRYTGPVSWTGTMFEYFMPYLFLPAPKGSMSYEGLEFCLWCQQKRTKKSGIPWGISESGFYAFDRQINYQYKAHGVQNLGLKRGLNNELVIAPYATFLALPLAPQQAMRNLAKLERMEMTGRCGFYEAADFTASRTAGQDYAVVRSYMAHHVGMSMLSVLNTLKENILHKRFLSDDTMAAATSLLLEKIPSGATVFKDVQAQEIPKTRERVEAQTLVCTNITPVRPRVKLLTNGEWTSVQSDVGAGYSVYRGTNVTRYSTDLLRCPAGVFAQLHCAGKVLPATRVLGTLDGKSFSAEFSDNEVVHRAKSEQFSLKTVTAVHPRLPCEQRQYTIRNHGAVPANGELLIYFEPSLLAGREEKEHPAFAKLFLMDSYDAANKLLLFHRKPRDKGHPLCLAVGFVEDVPFAYETARSRVLTGQADLLPQLQLAKQWQHTRGNPDACCALRVPVRLSAKGSRKLTLLVACAATQSEAVSRLIRAREQGAIAAGKGALCPFTGGGLASMISETVLPQLFYPSGQTKESAQAIGENTLRGMGVLWSMGISGDIPLLFVQIADAQDAGRALPYIQLNRRLRACSIATDVVIAYREGGEYDTPILSAIRELLHRDQYEEALGAAGGVHAINFDQRSEAELTAVKAAACFIAPNTARHLERSKREYQALPVHATSPVYKQKRTLFHVKGGAFTQTGFQVDKTEKSPQPWCFLYANQAFGTMVSEKALGFTWAVNARENKLTPWTNDTVTDNRGEMLLMQLDGKLYDLLAGASAFFSAGSAVWEGEAQGIRYTVEVSVPQKGMQKVCTVTLHNTAGTEKALQLAYYTEPVLGVHRDGARAVKGSRRHEGAVLTNVTSTIPGHLALTVKGGADFVCFERVRFFEGNWENTGSLPQPDPCAAVGKQLTLAPAAEHTVQFSLSWARRQEAALLLSQRGGSGIAAPEPALQIYTPDQALNVMVNTFLPTQILSARIYGRTGFYQCGGAWGFRDQLQDASAMIFTHPKLVKTHILRCCAVQFEQGDVLHWWHRLPKAAGGLRGVRTRCSDDMLWLPYVCAAYVRQTGDWGILDVQVPFLAGAPLREGENERYFQPQRSDVSASVYTHCMRAVTAALRFGEHGLPLIGIGDWNDGFSRVGEKGYGESVWLAQFMLVVMRAMLPLCQQKQDENGEQLLSATITQLRQTIERCAWDQDHYLRAFFDDGSPMGKTGNAQCAIDSLPQSFAVFAELDETRRKTALDTAVQALVDEQHGIIKLFWPPFTGTQPNPGYVAAYPQGIRENGGQYTHAAMWLILALLRENRTEQAYRLLQMVNPAQFYQNPRRAAMYRAEPYALAGDVSAAEGMQGCAGWSLYTGSAAWFYRIVVEELLGLRLLDGKLQIAPRLPAEWDTCAVQIMRDGNKTWLDLRTGGHELPQPQAQPQPQEEQSSTLF